MFSGVSAKIEAELRLGFSVVMNRSSDSVCMKPGLSPLA